MSVNYRHAPEARFPAAADDAFAAVQWIADSCVELGGIQGQLAVAGWSAGGNVAAVACQLARDAGGPEILGQLLVTPVTDSDMTRGSYDENGDGYVLTTPLMRWFWDYYADPAQRSDPKAAPIRGDLSGLPPAVMVTAEFDPLRDEGIAYARVARRRRCAGATPARPGPPAHHPHHGRRRPVRSAPPGGNRQGAAGVLPRHGLGVDGGSRPKLGAPGYGFGPGGRSRRRAGAGGGGGPAPTEAMAAPA